MSSRFFIGQIAAHIITWLVILGFFIIKSWIEWDFSFFLSLKHIRIIELFTFLFGIGLTMFYYVIEIEDRKNG